MIGEGIPLVYLVVNYIVEDHYGTEGSNETETDGVVRVELTLSGVS